MMEKCFGLATCFYPDSSPERWRIAAEGGFTDAEIDVSNNLDTEAFCAAAQKIYEDLLAGGLRPTSLHLPFGNQWDIASEDAEFRGKVNGELKKMIRWAGDQQIPIVVLHPSFEPIEDSARAAKLAYATESIRDLGAFASFCEVEVAVEDLPRTCLGNCGEELLSLIGGGEYAKVCFDVNHLLKESHHSFIQKVGRHIITTHLSDYDRVNERHWMPGDGCIDWKELQELLDGCGYSGRYLFELGENASPSLGRPFTPKELRERYLEVTR